MVKKYNTFEPQLVIAERNESAVVLTNEAKLSLYKKSQKSGISTDILEEVYRRGHVIWNESFGQTAEQFAFDRVNSFIAGGFALNLDDDLLEGKRGLWDNIHAKRKRIKAGSGERMRKPGSEGAPTDAAIKASQNEEADPCWDGYKQVGMKKKKGREVPNCVPVKENAEAHSKDKNKPSSRFVGSNELVDVYKKDTPGQSTLKTVKKAVKETLDEQSTTRFDQNWPSIQRGIRGVESGSTRGNYTIPKPRGLPGTASGAYAFTNKTWRDQLRLQGRSEDLKKYPRAHLAPPELQDQVFKTKTRSNYIKQGGDENPQALRRTLNIHYTGNPAGNMSDKQLRANRGTTSDAYWRKFQGLSKQDSPSEQPRSSTPTSSASSGVTKRLSAAPPPVPRPADLDKAPEPKAPETPSTTQARAPSYTVKKGDTADKIARQHNITLDQFRAANRQFRGDFDTIFPGQQFNVTTKQPTQTPGEPMKKLKDLGESSMVSEDSYTVRRGDNLGRIARQAGIPLSKIKELNPEIKDIDKIAPGQKVRTRAAAPAPAPAPAATPKAAEPPKQITRDFTLGSSSTDGFRKTPRNEEPPEKPQAPTTPTKVDRDYTLGSSASQGFRTQRQPEAPKSSTSGAVIADPNKDFGSQVGAWMQNWVDGQMRARQQRQQPEAPRTPSARTRTSSSDGMLSPEPMKKPQGPDMTLGSQRTFRAPDNSVSDQQKKDVEKIKREQESGNYLTTSGSRYGRTSLSTSDLSPEQNARRQERDRAKERGGQWEADFDQRMYRDWPLGPVQKSKNEETLSTIKRVIKEATHQGRKVTLNKPFRTPGGPKKSAVYVDPDGDGKAKIVRFGDPKLSIKKDQPARKRSYCARSSGQGNLTKKDSANYWSRRAWDC
jgi:LysM repeat protein